MPLTPPGRPRGDQRWSTFLKNHAKAIVACDFFVAVTVTFRRLYVFVVIEHGSRRLVHVNATAAPTADWTLQQLREAINEDRHERLIHDRDRIFSKQLDASIEALGLGVLRSPIAAPKANSICERVIGTIRRECLDWMIPLSEGHLRTILREWVTHYNRGRPHSALGSGLSYPPQPTAVFPKLKSRDRLAAGALVRAKSVLGGLQHEYALAPAPIAAWSVVRDSPEISSDRIIADDRRLIPELVEHPAGISRHLKTQEVSMKALIFRETGEPNSVLKLAEIPTPQLAPGEVLVRMLLSPIHPSDLHMLRGRYGYQPELPASPGIEGVGIVEVVGPGVQGPAVGTRVVLVHTWQTWCEQIVSPVDRLVPVPDGLDDSAAATSCTNPLTAWALTRSSHNLREGDWLLQTAAASTVGKLVLQLAQQYRFKTINVIRRREQETTIRNLGGNEVICTDDEDLRARLRELTAGSGLERAIDCVAGELGAEIARNLAPAGTMLVYGALSSHRQTDPAKFTMPLFAPRLIYSTVTVRGWWLPRWVSSQPLAEVRAATSDLLTMLSNGALTPPATVRHSLKDFQEAVRLADGEAGQQKVLLDFSE